jgi:hypothetical protein
VATWSHSGGRDTEHDQHLGALDLSVLRNAGFHEKAAIEA